MRKMKTMKKTLSLLLVAALLMSVFTACSKDGKTDKTDTKQNDNTKAEQNDSSKKEPDSKTEEKQVTLVVWGDTANQATQETTFTALNKAFEDKYPNIKLDYQYSGSYEALNVAVQSDSLPDLFWVQGNKTNKMKEMAEGGYLLNLDKYNFETSRFPDECIQYATESGSLYCSFPSFFDYALMYYNKDMFQKYNLSVPETWDDFVNILETLKSNGETPISFGGKGEFDRYWLMGVMGPALYDNVLGQINDRVTDVDYSNMVKGFNYYREFAEKGYLGENIEATDGTGAQLAFMNGKAAMIVDGTWSNSIYSESGLNVGRFALPGEDGLKYSQYGPSNVNTYAASSKTKYPDEAAKYIEFLNSLEAQQIVFDNFGSIPMVKDIEIADEATKEMADFDVVGYNIYNVLSSWAGENCAPQDIFLGDILPKLMMSEYNGDEAVAKLKDELAKGN
ncbi:MAG: extracellular solute-binding protein [Anaerolineaceae bacterium]|nr:MAG: extracellular solute-binding protein [Anaerolineaceae bacterium]